MDAAPCPMCDGDAVPLGALGSTPFYRCVCCGWTFAVTEDTNEGLS